MTPVTATDFIVYGHVSHYNDPCLFNPCFPFHLVVDNRPAFLEALKVPVLKESLEKLYGKRVSQALRNPVPEPDDPFVPMIIPLKDDTAIPQKEQLHLTVKPEEFSFKTSSKKTEKITFNAVADQNIISLASEQTLSAIQSIDRIQLGRYVDRFRLFCKSSPLSNVLLRFQEYDRSAAELAGDVYSGNGNREFLGRCFTDRNGNYIYRFTRDINDFVSDAVDDTAPGENAFTQQMPDIIAQLLDEDNPSTSVFETAPYWNIPLLRRINICIPDSKLTTIPKVCGQHDYMIQGIGNIELGPLNTGTNIRSGFGNTLTANGLITTSGTSPTPSTQCAAWKGNLEVLGCMSNKDISYYTVQYKKQGQPDSQYQFINEPLMQSRYSSSIFLFTIKENVALNVDLRINGNSSPKVNVKAFLNVQTDSSKLWTEKSKIRKALLRTIFYKDIEGPVEFLFETYRSNGNKLSFSEKVTLYIDNNNAIRDINNEVSLGGQALGNCALFTLPAGNLAAPLTVRFQAEHNKGFMANYNLHMLKGATGGFGIAPGVAPANFVSFFKMDNVSNTGRTYVHGSSVNCDLRFRGTINEPWANLVGDDYEVAVTPASGNWLEANQQFCAFSIRLDGHTRHTNGTHGYPYFGATPVLIGIQKASLPAPAP